ncbi:MAG: transposase, partial [Deltaproteobacteria bacterium]
IHATCDALGNPTGFHLSPGQAHDLQGADVLLEALLDQIEALLADFAYAARARLLDRLERQQVEAVPRGIATRYDKRACAFLGGIHWVAAVIWLN